jgi:hypothetical protein
MADPLQNALEVFSAPIEGVIIALGQGIAEAQRALDENSIRTQAELDADPIASRNGLQATWYQFPRVDLTLKLALTVTTQPPPPPGPAAGGVPAGGAPAAPVSSALRLIAQPVSAAFQNHFNYDASAASTITLAIVPVPPPQGGQQGTVAPRMARDAARAAALATGKFTYAKDGQGNPLKDKNGVLVPAPNLRLDVNYNAFARTWYVLQYDSATPAQAVVVAVDDATGVARLVSS